MGGCMSICESTPSVPANIIADPEVRARTERASMSNVDVELDVELDVAVETTRATRRNATND